MCLLRRRGLKGGVVRIRRRGLKRDGSKGVLPSCHVCHYSTPFVPSHNSTARRDRAFLVHHPLVDGGWSWVLAMLRFSAGKGCPGGAQRSGLGMLWASPGQDGGSSGLGGALTTAPSFHECSKCFVCVQSCSLAMGHGEAVGLATLLTPCGKGSAPDEPRGGPPEPLGGFRAQPARLVFLLTGVPTSSPAPSGSHRRLCPAQNPLLGPQSCCLPESRLPYRPSFPELPP